MRKRTVALVAGTIAIIVLIGVFAWRTLTSREEALEQSRTSSYLATLAYQRVKGEMQVSEAMTISDVDRLLGDAWHHTTCSWTEDWTQHMFFFGSRDLDKTGVVLVEMRRRGGRQTVTNVYIVQNYMLLEDSCVRADPSLNPKGRG